MMEIEIETVFIFPKGDQHQDSLILDGYENGSNSMNVKLQFFGNPLLLEKQMIKKWGKSWGGNQFFQEGLGQIEKEKRIMLENVLTKQANTPTPQIKPKV